MTEEQEKAEIRYILARSIYVGLFNNGTINWKQMRSALKYASEKYRSLCGELEVNSIAGQDDYTGEVSATKENKDN